MVFGFKRINQRYVPNFHHLLSRYSKELRQLGAMLAAMRCVSSEAALSVGCKRGRLTHLRVEDCVLLNRGNSGLPRPSVFAALRQSIFQGGSVDLRWLRT